MKLEFGLRFKAVELRFKAYRLRMVQNQVANPKENDMETGFL